MSKMLDCTRIWFYKHYIWSTLYAISFVASVIPLTNDNNDCPSSGGAHESTDRNWVLYLPEWGAEQRARSSFSFIILTTCCS